MASAHHGCVDIDGNILEGGGQILRNAVAFSALLNIPIRIYNIRGGRDKPGLRPQHLSGLELVRDMCHGKLTGNQVGSTEITFIPGKLEGGEYFVDTRTAGSVVLLMQVAVPCALFARTNCRFTFKGGTNADKAPQIDYVIRVFKQIVQKFGVDFDVNLVKRGFYPKGGGEIVVDVKRLDWLKSVEILDRGEMESVSGISWIAGTLPAKIAQASISAAKATLQNPATYVSMAEPRPKSIDIELVVATTNNAIGNGNGMVLVGHTKTGCLLGGDSLGRKGISGEQVGRDAADMLLNNLRQKGCVDEYLQDQLIIFMALAEGKSRIKTGQLTLHTKTAIYVAELLSKVKFVTEICDDESVVIECGGIGLKNAV